MFQTKVEMLRSDFNITYQERVMTLGSCFAENIGKKMGNVYFDTEVNPFGVLYNPVSIHNSIRLLLQNRPFTPDALFENRGLWQCFSHSSLFSNISMEQCLTRINERFVPAATFFQQTDYLLITFGTAWVFEEKKSGSVVSNCHKLPASHFVRRRLSVDEIVTPYSTLLNELSNQLPHLKVIFSISPIRHWKDGAHENTVSKSTLLLAVDTLQQQFSNVLYFPAYEIQMDELRDYRFYASDMLHPSDVAVDYIWSRFSETYFDEATTVMKAELEQLASDLSHRPLHPESDEFEKFKNSIQKKRAALIKRYPFLEKRILKWKHL